MIPEKCRPDPLPFGLSHAYEALTGSRQLWEMFRTTPTHHDYHVITGVDGLERRAGPLLPGFQPWPVPEEARIYNLFQAMLNGTSGGGRRDAYAGLRLAYLRRVDHALEAQRLIVKGEKWCLELDEDYTRHLWHVRQDGGLFLRGTTRFSLDSPDGIPFNP